VITNPEVEIRWHVTACTTTCNKIIDSNGVQAHSKDYVTNEIEERGEGGIHMFSSRTSKKTGSFILMPLRGWIIKFANFIVRPRIHLHDGVLRVRDR